MGHKDDVLMDDKIKVMWKPLERKGKKYDEL